VALWKLYRKMRPISWEKEQNIVALIEKGRSSREIAKSVGLAQSTVNRVRKRLSTGVALSKGGRPKVLTKWEKRYASRLVIVGGLETATEASKVLRRETGVKMCDNTLRNALREQGLSSFTKVKKPALSQKNIKDRFRFAQMHKDWTVSDWERVVFSDETKICRFNSDGRSWCWVEDKENIPVRAVNQTVKHGGGSIMLWGCLTCRGLGSLQNIQGRLNARGYIAILEQDLCGTLLAFGFNLEEIIFQQDNAAVHTAKIVREWLGKQPFCVLEWPAQSPDLNPIEHIWALLKRRLNSYSSPPSGIIQLWARVQEVCNSISLEECRGLYASMPDRIAAVLAAKGRWTKF
jgi:transposase